MRHWNLVLAALLSSALLISCREERTRVVEDFNFEWKFTLGDSGDFASASFDDSGWRSLHLPHDWSIEGEFSKDNPSTPGGGALPGGTGWYRKFFPTPDGVPGKKVYVEFDGVFMNSTVYVNGHEAGTRPYGYSSFSYDITGFLNTDGTDNLIAVRCDNAEQPNSRWYAGCGIYRDVRLVTVNPVHVAYNGVFVRTSEVSDESAKVSISTDIEGGAEKVTTEYIIRDLEGRKVASGNVNEFEIENPYLWDLEYCIQYTLEVRVSADGVLSDVYYQNFGIRKADRGFFLNGKPVKLLGVCLHHDMGCLGTAVHRRALERELGILKEMGCNAIRTSHNPPSPVLLELCDNMGFLVIDEAMDMWRKHKTTFDYARFFDEWHEADVQDFIRRDRNHPCVIMWSIGNEIPEQHSSAGEDNGDDNPNILLARHMAELVKELDDRPVTSGCDQPDTNNNIFRSGALDVYGFNYHTADYDNVREWYPDKPLYGSETASSLNSRGVYFQPSTLLRREPEVWWKVCSDPHHQCTAYDALCAPWADYHEHAWVAIRDREYMAGTFVWTGFDYLGEPTPYSWPSRSSYFGIVDLAGFPKDIYYMYQSEWSDKDVLHLFPHWNWAPGDSIDLWCWYNNADEVELFLNGRSLGRSHKEGEQLRAQWLSVPWEEGKIEAVAYRDGEEVGRTSRETTGKACSIKLEADRQTIDADGYDLSYVTVTATDDRGREVPVADNMLEFSVSGNGELVGVDNGNAADTLSLKGSRKALFSGKALAVIRSIKGSRGTVELCVSSEDGSLKEAVLKINCK
ncbi:MAG: DUF4982 domain-containing protein [Bacteroidales bacterium]|nr:DUF4982 domain-containing protein [Bacteroidales bacterium]